VEGFLTGVIGRVFLPSSQRLEPPQRQRGPLGIAPSASVPPPPETLGLFLVQLIEAGENPFCQGRTILEFQAQCAFQDFA